MLHSFFNNDIKTGADGTDSVLMWIHLSKLKFSYLQFSNVLSLCFPAQMQQQELAQMRQRDANLTALAAIGPRKKRKLDSPGGATAGTEVRDETSYIHSVTAFTVSRGRSVTLHLISESTSKLISCYIR